MKLYCVDELTAWDGFEQSTINNALMNEANARDRELIRAKDKRMKKRTF